ncbi:hypothetical protein CEP51_016141 [Fusarium floridanum]|uniref:Heterokaryon incompatibility domain-containing protein n=1 Tax=Fusarium floridanum TaxID=1325733 RepID=A0A428NWH5_9HYPO|nr:hypothetical protein CEP51_016141 [Fusarium floridanum]
MRPNPDIPKDRNLVSFEINHTYTKQGCLDGRRNLTNDPDYPVTSSAPKDASYYKPGEFDRHSLLLYSKGESLPQRTHRNICNSYVWTADGGTFRETNSTLDMVQSEVGGNLNAKISVGASFDMELAFGNSLGTVDVDAMYSAHFNFNMTKEKTSDEGFELDAQPPPPVDIRYKDPKTGKYVKRPGAVDVFRWISFWLEPSVEATDTLSEQVIDPIWLEESPESNAQLLHSLREALAKETGNARTKAWRVLHRCTFVSRVPEKVEQRPAALANVQDEKKSTSTLLADVACNWLLTQKLEPFARGAESKAQLATVLKPHVTKLFPSLITQTRLDFNFKYTALRDKEIRVLVLDSGNEGDALFGALVPVKHVPGEHITRYEAMSYTWGDQSNPDYIALRHPKPDKSCVLENCGNKSSGSLPIGRNLALALRQLRHETNSRTLWADSICINQRDLDERAAQVQRMRHIYKYAQRVIAWLGPADQHSPMAMGMLQELADCVDFANEEEDMMNNRMSFKRDRMDFIMNGHTDDIHDWSKPLPFSGQQWQAVTCLISRTWFRRLWVRQEILLAGKDTILLVGGDSMPWLHFTSAIEIIAQKREALADKVNIHTMIEFSNVRSFSFLRHLRDFFTLVALTHACEVTEPRDRVFALLGLAEGGFTSEIVVDYRKDVKDVHRDALVRASTYHENLKLLSLCDSASEPTWIPDLDRIQHLRPMISGRAALFSAEKAYTLNKEQLVLQGVRCDYITELIGPRDGQDSQAQLGATVLEAARRFLGHDAETWDFQKVQQFSHMLHVHDFFIHPPHINKTQEQLAKRISTHSETLGAQLTYLTYFMHHRSIYLTKMGYIVLGPRNCQPGDPVVVFLGCHLPMVLRSIEDGEYNLRGPCAHPALLNSEAILGEMPKGWRLRYVKRVGEPLFENPEGERQHIDPRLDNIPVPEEWELRWRNDGTPFWYIAKEDRWTDFDPRLSLDSLRKRGVRVDDYILR